MLGPSWPGRQFERKGWWPGEFNLLMFHAAAVSSEHEVQRVESPMGRAEVRRAGSPTPERTFVIGVLVGRPRLLLVGWQR